MNLKNKVLLVLGGTTLSCEIIKQAKKQGAKVYVTDYLENSPGKKIADKSFMVSTIDVDGVVNLIRTEKINGVLTGFIDMLLPYYYDICHKANIPCYLSKKEQIFETTYKTQFKALCKKFNVPVVQEYFINPPFTQENTEEIEFPVLIKPSDNSGARGIFICNNLLELQENYKKALEFSKNKQILIEKYIHAKEATAFYLMQDGEIFLSSMGDRHMKNFQEKIIPLPVGYTFPSKHLDLYQKQINQKVIDMFQHIGIKNGMAFIQMFVTSKGFILYEMGYRLTGSLEYKIIHSIDKVNPLQCMVNYALTQKMSNKKLSKKINPNYKKHGANITFLAKPGIIKEIKGVKTIKNHPKVLDIVLSYQEQEEIPLVALGTLNQVFARAFVVAKTYKELKNLISFICNTLQVKDVNGQSLLINDCSFMEDL